MDSYTKLARKTIETYFKNGKIINTPANLPEEMLDKKAGVFVSFKKGKELRGCIGTFLPAYKNMAQEIIQNTIASATEDPRFLPINKKEINDLKISIDILSEPQQVPANEINRLDPKKYGILVRSQDGLRSGLLLPDLEGVETIEEQLSIACQKAGINKDAENFIVYKFTVQRHEEK